MIDARHERLAATLGMLLQYGSIDLGLGVTGEEIRTVDGAGGETDRLLLSLGLSHKRHRQTWSIAGLVGGDREEGTIGSATVGYRLDLARGLSWNAGWTWFDGGGDIGDGSLGRTSVSYSV